MALWEDFDPDFEGDGWCEWVECKTYERTSRVYTHRPSGVMIRACCLLDAVREYQRRIDAQEREEWKVAAYSIVPVGEWGSFRVIKEAQHGA